ncbi:MAG: phage protein Gp37 [Alphaproteobacteria bacterium]|nr:phage protein Gp37 [Alphaproteobacteria bacterium]
MITNIENAIIARIQAAQDAPGVSGLGYKLRKLATYGGEFADGIDRIVTDFPAILVAFNGAQLQQEARVSFALKATFGLICCSTSLRNEKTARHGVAGKVGSYQLVMDVIALLAGQKLGLDIMPLKPAAIRPLINDKAGAQLASVYAVDFDTIFRVEPSDASSIDDFRTFAPAWDIPPHGNVQPPLPAAEADAHDHITLPIQGE